MKTKLITLFVVLSAPVFAQSNPGVPDLPPDGTVYTVDSLFFAGLTLGFIFGGSAWIFRLVRQAGHQNPEI
jgi:hypothetical protein